MIFTAKLILIQRNEKKKADSALPAGFSPYDAKDSISLPPHCGHPQGFVSPLTGTSIGTSAPSGNSSHSGKTRVYSAVRVNGSHLNISPH